MTRTWIGIIAFALVVGCTPPETPEDKQAMQPKPETPTPQEIESLEPKITDSKVGTGAAIEEGDMFWVEYRGTFPDGTEFDTNKKEEGFPLYGQLGSKGLIVGFEKGMKGMKVGGHRKIEVPWQLGYGLDGNPSANIKPQQDLVFDVDLLYVIKKGHEAEYESKDIKVGTGPAAKKGDPVTVHYTGTFLSGKKFDSSVDRGQPFPFTIGAGGVIQGWDDGVIGMKVGGKRQLILPPKLAYGESGNQGIPGNSVLKFEIEMLKIGQ